MSIISGALNPIASSIGKTIREKTTHSIEVSDFAYMIEAGLGKYFKSLPDIFYMDNSNNPSFKKNISLYTRTTKCGNMSSTIFYKGFPITYKGTFTDNPRDGGSASQIELITINTPAAIKNLKRFIKECANIEREKRIKNTRKEVSAYGIAYSGRLARIYLPDFKKRTFENTFIPAKQEECIKSYLDKFISNRDWYMKNHVPYHFGFLLYGSGGTGKTTLVQAIADYINAELMVVPGDAINELPRLVNTDFGRTTMDPSVYRVICVEDIDIGFAQSKMVDTWDDDSDEVKTVQRKVGLAEILNCLDGVLAPQNTIFVFTTNHIEKLDPALIRPGRCDVKLEINGICLETLYKFCRYHYSTYETSEIIWGIGEVLESDEDIREDATFGELQTAVMKGASITEICKMIKKK